MVRVRVSVQQFVPSIDRKPSRSNSRVPLGSSLGAVTVSVTLATLTWLCSSPRKPADGLAKDHPGCCGRNVSLKRVVAWSGAARLAVRARTHVILDMVFSPSLCVAPGWKSVSALCVHVYRLV